VTDSLEDILARKTQEQPVQETTEQPTQEQVAPEVTPDASAETPAQETVSGEGKSLDQKMVPHEALHAEKQKVKRYTEEVADFRKSNEDLRKQVAELLQRVPVQAKQEQQAVDWWGGDPNVAFQQSFAQSIDPMLSPMKQQLQMVTGFIQQMQAKEVFGDKLTDFTKFVNENKDDPEVMALAVAMDGVPDPFTYAKQWYDKKTFDPDAERERIKAQLLEEMKSQQQTQQPTTVMPSNLTGVRNVGNRSGPSWAGPPSLSDIFKR
jgi:hypothetical protein